MKTLFSPWFVSLAQGTYFLVTGLWPIASSQTFQKVTGPKVDLWLVKTIGSLIANVGLVLMIAGLGKKVSPEVTTLAVGSAAGLGASDVIYVAKRRIRPVYLLDALAEAALILWWLIALFSGRK